MKRFLLFINVLLCFFSVEAQTPEELIDSYVYENLSNLNIPVLDIAIVQKDSVLLSKRYGTKNDPGKQFYIGSLSKSLTAFTVLTLVQDSLLSLEERVSDRIPGIKFSDYKNEVKIRHLLNHTSGILKTDGFRALPVLSDLSEKTFNINIGFEPGTQHEYSNLNYSLLGLIVEQVSGLTFSEYIKASVLLKMNMNSTGAKEVLAVNQYQYLGPFPIKSAQLDFNETAIPAGFILSSASDIANYLITNLGYGEYKAHPILDSSLVHEMHSPWNGSDFGYGMGWKKGIYNDVPFIQHLGSTATSAAAMFIVPTKELGLIMLTNSNSLIFSEELAEGLLGILVGDEPKPTTKKEFYLRSGLLFLLLIVSSRFVYQLFSIKKNGISVTFRKICWDLAAHVIIIGVFVYFFPIFTDVPFIAFLKLQPDIGILLILAFVFPMIIKLLSLFMIFSNNLSSKKI